MNLVISITSITHSSIRYDIIDTWIGDEAYNMHHNALIYSDKINIHIMHIQPDGVESITSIYLYSKFHLYSVHDDNKKVKFNMHIKHCDGKYNAELMLDKVSHPYCPGILGNPFYEYCLAYVQEWKIYHGCLTNNFETSENQINDTISSTTTLKATLTPKSVSSCFDSESNKQHTVHFDIIDSYFIPHWIVCLFNEADHLLTEKLELHSQVLFHQHVNVTTIKILHNLDHHINNIYFYGFNSSRFDSNLFKQYFNYTFEWNILED